MSLDAIKLANDFGIYDPSILTEDEKSKLTLFPTPKQFIDVVSATDGNDLDFEELGNVYTQHYKDYAVDALGMPPLLADARALSIKKQLFTGMDSNTFNDTWNGVLNPQQQQAETQQQQKLEKQQGVSLLDTAQHGYSDMKAAEMLDLNRQYREAIPKLEKDINDAGPMTRWFYDLTLEDSKKSLKETEDWLAQYEADKKTRAINPTLEKIQQAKTAGDTWDAIAEHPIDAIAYGAASSAIPSALMLGNAYLGNRFGGTTGGMVAGGSASAETEYKSGVMEALTEAGVDVGDRQALEKALKDPELMGKIDLQAGQKAAVVGTLDAASLGIAGKLFPDSALKSVAANAVVQPALGAGGEAGGSVYSGQDIKPGAVALEALGEVPSSVIEVATMRRGNQSAPSVSNRDTPPNTTTITPEPIQAGVNPLSQFAQQAPQNNQPNVQPQNELDLTAIVDRMIGAESAGKADAKNPYSSAEGLGQFIDSTWLAMVKKHRPDLARGKTDESILALKTDGALSREMTTRYAEDNMRELQADGFEVTGRNVYLAHHFGSGGARTLLNADPNSPVASVVSAQVIQQNPYMKGKNVGEVLNIIDSKMGGQAGTVSNNQSARTSQGFQRTTTEPTVNQSNEAQSSTPSSPNTPTAPQSDTEPQMMSSVQADGASPAAATMSQPNATEPANSNELLTDNPQQNRTVTDNGKNLLNFPQSQVIPSTEATTSVTANTRANAPDTPSKTAIPTVDIPAVGTQPLMPAQGLPAQAADTQVPQQSSNPSVDTAKTIPVENPASSQQAPMDAPAAIAVGKKGVVLDENNNEHEVSFEVVDAADLSVPEVAEPKKRSQQSKQNLESLIKKPVYGRLNSQHTTMNEGAPVLGQDQAVIAGKNRILGLQGAYAEGNAVQYKKRLIADLKSQGVDTAAISQMKAPILVRRMQRKPTEASASAKPSNLAANDTVLANSEPTSTSQNTGSVDRPSSTNPLYNVSPSKSFDQTIHQVATDKKLSTLAEDALLSVFGSSPKNQSIATRLLRQFFFDNFVPSDTYPDSRSFVTAQMNELRSSGALQAINDTYFSGNAAFKLKDDANRKPISADKAEAAIRRILGDIPFETRIPAEIKAGAGEAANRVKGAFANGKIYIETRNIGSIAEAEALAVEELTHRGVANLFGDEYESRLNALYEAIGGEAGIRRFTEQHKIEMADDYFKQSPTTQIDELLAHIEANQNTLTVRVKRAFQRIIAHLRNAIRALNTRVLHNVSDSDIVLIARNARNAAKESVKNPMANPRFGIRPEQESAAQYDAAGIKALHDQRRRRSGRLRRYLKTQKQTWGDRRDSANAALFQSKSAEQSALKRWIKRHFYSDSFLGRDVADAKRGLDWHKTADHDEVKSDVVALEAIIENAFGKHRSELTRDEQEQFHNALTGKEPLPNEVIQAHINLYRERIDDASRKLVAEKYREMQMRIDELNDEGRALLGTLAKEWLDPNYQYDEGTPIPLALTQIHRLQMQISNIEGNLGQYLHRSYQAFTDPKWVDKVKRKPIYQDAIRFIQEEHDLDHQAAATKLSQWLEGTRSHTNLISLSSLGGKNEAILKRRKDLPPVLREVLGEFTDPVYNYANTITQVASYVAYSRYQMTLRHLFKSMPQIASIGQATEQHTAQFPQHAGYSILNDVFVEGEFLKELQAFGVDKPLSDNEVMQALVSTSAAVKVGKTIGAPTTQMRNFWSGFLLLAQAGHSPFGEFKDTYELMRYAKNRVNPLTGNLLLGKQDAMMLNQKYVRLGVRRDGASSGELEKMFNDFHQMDTAVREQGLLRQSFGLLLRSYQFSDDFFKIIHFEKGYADLVKAGLSPAAAEIEAARRTRDTMPTYSMIPRWVRTLRQFPLIAPFVSFPYEQLRTLKNNLAYMTQDFLRYQETGNKQWLMMAGKRAFGLAIGFVMPTLAAMASRGLAGVDDEEDDALDHFGSDWRRGQLRLYIGRSENGLNYVDLTSLVPSEYVIRAIRQGWLESDEKGAWAGLVEGAAALGKPYYQWDIATQGFMSLANNFDAGTGRDVYGEGKSIFDLLKQPGENQQHWGELVRYVSRQYGPGIMQNINDFSRALAGTVSEEGEAGLFSSVLNEYAAGLGGNLSRSGKQFTEADAVAALLGFRVTTQDVNTLGVMASGQTRSKIAAYSAEFKQALDTTIDLSPEFIDSRIEQVIADRQRAYEKMQDLVYFYQKKGRSASEIADLLYEEKRTLGKEEVKQLVRGKVPEFEPSKELLSRSLTIVERISNPAERLQAKKVLAERYRYVVRRAAEMQRVQ